MAEQFLNHNPNQYVLLFFIFDNALELNNVDRKRTL